MKTFTHAVAALAHCTRLKQSASFLFNLPNEILSRTRSRKIQTVSYVEEL